MIQIDLWRGCHSLVKFRFIIICPQTLRHSSKTSQKRNPKMFRICVCISISSNLSIYLYIKTRMCVLNIKIFMFLFRCIHISIYFYLDITSGISKSWRTKYWLPSVLQTQPECLGNSPGKGKSLMYWCDCSLFLSQHQQRLPWLLLVLPGQPAGLALVEAAGQEQDRDWDGVGGELICTLPVRSPLNAQVSPAATQPSQGRQGWGEEGRLGSPIKFYTSLHCFSGCFQNQKIQEIYSQMFPCLFVDSV